MALLYPLLTLHLHRQLSEGEDQVCFPSCSLERAGARLGTRQMRGKACSVISFSCCENTFELRSSEVQLGLRPTCMTRQLDISLPFQRPSSVNQFKAIKIFRMAGAEKSLQRTFLGYCDRTPFPWTCTAFQNPINRHPPLAAACLGLTLLFPDMKRTAKAYRSRITYLLVTPCCPMFKR